MFQFLKRLAQVGAVAAATAVLMSPQAADARSLDEILSSGTLKVGVNPTLPPLGTYDDKNQIVGFDVDYAQKLADMLGVKLEVVQVGSPDRIPFVASGKIDIVMGAMTRNPETTPRHRFHPAGPYRGFRRPYDQGKRRQRLEGIGQSRHHHGAGPRQHASPVQQGEPPPSRSPSAGQLS